jgi:hypothetical protein
MDGRKQLVMRLPAYDLGNQLAGVSSGEPAQIHPGDPADTIKFGQQRAQRVRVMQVV